MTAAASRPGTGPALQPADQQQVAEGVRQARQTGVSVGAPAADGRWDFSALTAEVLLNPPDMILTAETGHTLGHLKSTAAASGLWLPLDSCHPGPISLAQYLSEDWSLSWLSQTYGTLRDWVMELRAVNDRGEPVRSGARVVKNVAGYHLAPLFIGAWHALGPVLEVSLRLIPSPSDLNLLRWSASNPNSLLDIWMLSTRAQRQEGNSNPWVALRLSGAGDRWRLEGLTQLAPDIAKSWGDAAAGSDPATVDACAQPPDEPEAGGRPLLSAHCLPSRLRVVIAAAAEQDLPLVAYPGTGALIIHDGGRRESRTEALTAWGAVLAAEGGWVRPLGEEILPAGLPRRPDDNAAQMAEVKAILDPDGLFGPMPEL